MVYLAFMAERDTQFLKGILTMLLLRLLTDIQDYGYSVVERLRDLGLGDVKEGTVYPALTRLETRGWLTSELVPSDQGPARKYYRTTSEGVAEMERQEAAWKTVVAAVGKALENQSTAS